MRALLVLCEGHHDVVFVRRSLGAIAGGQYFPGRIRDLPAPFGSSGGGAGFIKTQYARLELEAKLASDYAACLDGRPARHGGWTKGPWGPIGLFVFHDSDADTRCGTLEDALAPMVQDAWPERWDAAGLYLDAHATETDSIRGKAAAYKKARITVAGQFVCPGEPMSRVIDRGGLPNESFRGPVSRALVAFLRAVPW